MRTRRTDPDAWTPYGLEALRQEVLRKRRIGALAFVAFLVLAGVVLTQTTTTMETDIFANGQRQSSLQIDVPERDDTPRGPDATISISPGRVTRMDTLAEEEPGPQAPGAAPPRDLGRPVNWMGWLMFLAPFALLATILWAGFRGGSGPLDEVNFGVYKGAMPLEMITASHAHLVVSRKRAPESLFGKRRIDYVPGESGRGGRRARRPGNAQGESGS